MIDWFQFDLVMPRSLFKELALDTGHTRPSYNASFWK